MLRKIIITSVVVLVALTFTEYAFAAADRLLEEQGNYIGKSTAAWEVAVKGLLFLMGMAAIGFSGWHMLMDYVFAKADHEKKFSIGKLLVGAIIGSLLCVPYSAIVIGGDLTGAGQKNSTLGEADFIRKKGS
jgi:hypothetical protein